MNRVSSGSTPCHSHSSPVFVKTSFARKRKMTNNTSKKHFKNANNFLINVRPKNESCDHFSLCFEDFRRDVSENAQIGSKATKLLESSSSPQNDESNDENNDAQNQRNGHNQDDRHACNDKEEWKLARKSTTSKTWSLSKNRKSFLINPMEKNCHCFKHSASHIIGNLSQPQFEFAPKQDKSCFFLKFPLTSVDSDNHTPKVQEDGITGNQQTGGMFSQHSSVCFYL